MLMTRKAVLAALVISLTSWIGCDDDDEDTGTTTSGAQEPTPPADAGDGTATADSGTGAATTGGSGAAEQAGAGGSAAAAGSGADANIRAQRLSEAEVAQILTTINDGEIMQGQLAVMRAQGTAVQEYAMRMVTEHTTANTDLMALEDRLTILPASSQLDRTVQMQADQTMETLNAADDASFDLTYMNAQVMQHAQIVTLIDMILLPSLDEGELRDTTQTMRDTAQSHLEDAQTIAAVLNRMQ